MSRWLSPVAWGLALLLSALAWLHAPGDAGLQGVTVDGAEMRRADEPWRSLNTAVLAQWPGPYEVRWRLHLKQDERALVLRLALRGASELRCNGQWVASNGRPGATAAEEVPGRVDRWIVLPPLPAGTHVLQLTGSSHFAAGRFAHAEAVVVPMPFDAMPRQRYARWLVVALAWGGLALTWLYFIRLRPASSSAPPGGQWHRWSLIALGAAGLLLPLAESARDLWGYAYPLHALRLGTILGSTLAATWLLPLSLSLRWGWPRRPLAWAGGWAVLWALVLLIVLFVALRTYGYDVAAWSLHLLGLAAALLLAWRARHRAHESMPALLTLLTLSMALLWAYPAAFLDGLCTVALAMVMTLLMLSHSSRQQAQALTEAGWRQSLQAQLLRASMQPHGLMNTLTVLQELIEQRPAIASRLVERLADQFSLLRVLSQKPLVSLREELALVRTQLDLVEMAREMPIVFESQGPIDAVHLPPGLLHTLVENAVTHGGVRPGAAPFSLRIEACGADRWTLQLRSPRGAGREGGGGLGQRFVRESLTGVFGTAWSYDARPQDAAVWLDCLTVPRR
jgi:hypothetical protein